MLDREDGVKNLQAKRDRDKIDWLEGVIRRIQSSGHVLANVGILACSPMWEVQLAADQVVTERPMGEWDVVDGV